MSKDPYNPMHMKALLCFATMAKHGSLTQASIELGISDAAVSQRIRSLEKHLGTKLYEARGGQVRLTDAGRRTRATATRMFDQLSELEDEVLGHEYRGTIVVSAGATVIRHQLPQMVNMFRQDYQLAKLRLLSRGTSETIELVRRNEVDAGIVPFPQSMPTELVFHPW